jgi:hypothetical protein
MEYSEYYVFDNRHNRVGTTVDYKTANRMAWEARGYFKDSLEAIYSPIFPSILETEVMYSQVQAAHA